MQHAINILNECRSISGNAQIVHLQYHKSELLKEILEYTYNPHKLFKINESKLTKFYTPAEGPKKFDVDDWQVFKYSFLDHLTNIKSAKDEDIKDLVEYFSNFALQDQEFLKMIIFKDLRLNMSVKKFQKIWPSFCVEPQVQLANKHEGQLFESGLYSRKFDGKRMYVKDGMAYSRSNNECYTKPLVIVLDQIAQMLPDSTMILDGECLYFEHGLEDFQKGISLCQSEEAKPGWENICYVIFDMIPKDNFLSKTPYKPFKEVYKDMIDNYANLNYDSPDYSLIPTNFSHIYIARQDEDATTLSELARKNNWEGLMYRNADSCYEYKRTKNLLKIKKMEDIELKLIDMEEGTGRHAGRLGAFVVEYKGSRVNIGSGFTDEQRQEYWNNKDKYIGEYVKTQYFEETVNQEGKLSLRFPVFISFRNIDTGDEFLIK